MTTAAHDPTAWKAWGLAEIERRQGAAESPYLEFLRVPAMSSGLYVLPAGGEDRQSPHAQDELYVVLEGDAMFAVDGDDVTVTKGSVIFVPAGMEHRFYDIERDLKVLVLFSPAETAANRNLQVRTMCPDSASTPSFCAT